MKKLMVAASLTKLPVGERSVYRLFAKYAHKMSEDQFLVLMTKKTGMTLEQCRYWLDAFRSTLFESLAENSVIDLNFLFAKLYITGSIANPGDQPTKKANPVVGRVFFKGPFAEQLAEIELENETLTVETILYEVMQDGASDLNRIESATARVVMNVSKGKIDPNQPDNGVWLENVKTGVKVADAEIDYSDMSTCYCRFPTLPPTGQYRLVLATRNGESPETYALAKVTRKVFVLNEEVNHE